MISITEKAANKIKEISDADAVGHYIIRVKVKGGGCGGIMHDLSFDDQISETDESIIFDGVKVVVDQLSFQYLENLVIDYKETIIGGGFTFGGPDIKSTCGCGNSVSY